MSILRNPEEKMITLIGVGTVLSLVYSIFNYAFQVALLELFGYQMRGLFEILMSFVGIVSVIFSFNYYTVINLYVSNKNALPVNYGSLSIKVLAAQLVGILIVYFVSDKSIMNAHWHMVVIPILLLSIVLSHKVSEFTAILNGNHHFFEAKLLPIYGSIFTAGSIGALYLVGFRDWVMFVCVAVVGPFAGSYLYVLVLRKKIAGLMKRAGELKLRDLYAESRAIYIISIAQFVFVKVFLLLISREGVFEMVGIFGFAYSVSQFILLPATFLATIVISTHGKSLAGLKKGYVLILCYGFLSCIALSFAVRFGILQAIPLKSFRNPVFIKIFWIMTFSIPFSILNILTVATAIRKNMCSKLFVTSQLLLLPVSVASYYLLRSWESMEIAISVAYTLAWMVASVFGVVCLKWLMNREVIV